MEKPGWFRANYDAQLCDRVNERVNKMLAGVRKDLEEADETIGGKLHVLDTDNDGRISVEELKRVGGVLAEALDEDDQRELERILADLSVDARGGQIDVAELTRVVENSRARSPTATPTPPKTPTTAERPPGRKARGKRRGTSRRGRRTERGGRS